LAVPLVAIFGSTDPVATGPVGSPSVIVRQALPCSPCLKTHCPQGHFRCMEELAVDEVLRQAEKMLDQHQSGGRS
ncbi:MAG: lipopolysaccharide heptosyltransferase II, partial [Desulfobulbaceae bacterium A2]